MKNKEKCSYKQRTLVIICFALLFVTLLTPIAYATAKPQQSTASGESAIIVEKGIPGGTIIEYIQISAKVIAVDTDHRKLTLQKSNGDELLIKVGPEAVNFNQIKVDDLVKANVTKELVVHLAAKQPVSLDGGAVKSLGYIDTGEVASTPDGVSGIVALAQKGAQPGGIIAGTVQVTATVTEIDKVNNTVTLSLENGTTKTFPVRDDIDLDQRKIGENVVFHMTEMVAVSVEKP